MTLASSRRARVALIGTVVDDHIIGADSTSTRALGGIVYGVATLAALAGDDLRVRPICRVGADLWPRLRPVWSSMPAVELDSIQLWEEPNTTVTLDYRLPAAGADRSERLLAPMPPLSWSEIEPALDCDVAIVNCITGFDVELEAVEKLAEHLDLYLDFHSLALGLAADGSRHFRPPAGLHRWLATADIVQCNEAELAVIASGLGCGVDDAIDRMLSAGPRAVVVTRAEQGAVLCESHGRLTIAAPSVDVADVTGAGDAFGAALVAARLLVPDPPHSHDGVVGDDLATAVRWAARVAAAACSLVGTQQYESLAARCGWPTSD